jgi:hypothetical protein
MFVNFGKNEGILFTINPPDHANNFRITLDGDVIGMKKEVRLLGLVFDSAVTMVHHVKKLQKICQFRQKQLSTIARYGRGGHSRDNRAAYFAFVHSQLIHNSSVYFPFLSPTNMQILVRI